MDADQFDKLHKSLNRIAAATLASSIINMSARKPTLKDAQMMFNDCYMIVDPDTGSDQQNDFQARLDKKEW